MTEPRLNKPVTPCALDHESFIFISYSHSDKEFILPIISGIDAQGYAIWFDQGIKASSDWTEEIGQAILGCKIFIIFISTASMDSEFVRKEARFAMQHKKTIVPVYLDDPEIVPAGLALELAATQGVVKILEPEVIVEKIAAALDYNEIEKSGPVGTAKVHYAKRRIRAEKKKGSPIKSAAAAILVIGLAALSFMHFFSDRGQEFVGSWAGTLYKDFSYPGAPPQLLYEIKHNAGKNYFITITKSSPDGRFWLDGSENMPIAYDPKTKTMSMAKYVGAVIDDKTGEMVQSSTRFTRVDPDEIRRQWAEEEKRVTARRAEIKAVRSATTLNIDQIRGLEWAGLKLGDDFFATEKNLKSSPQGYICDSSTITNLFCHRTDKTGSLVEAVTISALLPIDRMLREKSFGRPVKIAHIGFARIFPAIMQAEAAHEILVKTLTGQLGQAPGQVERTPDSITAYWMFNRQGRFISGDTEYFQACKDARPEIHPSFKSKGQGAAWEPIPGLPAIGIPSANDINLLCGLEARAIIVKSGDKAFGLTVTITHQAGQYDADRGISIQ